MNHPSSTWRRDYEAGSKRLLGKAWILVLACTLWLMVMTPVFPQESYYWLYGKKPALSYLDHPPMTGWLLYLSTSILGDGAIGLRLPTVLSALGVTWIGMDLLRLMGGSTRALILWVLFSISMPAFMMTHFLMLPDGPLVFFWTATLYALWRARETASLGWWVVAGAAAGCSLLSKYTAVFLLPAGVLILVLDPAMRRQLRKPGPWLALVLAVVFFIPVIIWNMQHDWASFTFQASSKFRRVQFKTHWLIQYVAGQIAILLPIVILFWTAIPWMFARAKRGSAKALWLAAFSLPILAFMLAVSLTVHVKINWVLPAYVTLGIAICLWLDQCRIDQSRPRLFRTLMITTLLLAALSFLVPLAEFLPQTGHGTWSGWAHIARRAEHWESIMDTENKIEGDIFFFCENAKDSSQLEMNLMLQIPDWNRDEVVFAQNVFGQEAVEYDFWNKLKDEIGRDAIFVLTNPDRRRGAVKTARKFFGTIKLVERIEIKRLGWTVVTADIYACTDYAGA